MGEGEQAGCSSLGCALGGRRIQPWEEHLLPVIHEAGSPQGPGLAITSAVISLLTACSPDIVSYPNNTIKTDFRVSDTAIEAQRL